MRTKFRLGLSLLTAAVALLVSAPAHAAPTRMVGALGQSSEGTWYLTDLEKRDPETKTPYLYVILRKENVPNFSVAYEYKATFYSDDNWKLKSVVVHGQRFDFAKSDTQTWTPREKPDKIAGHWAWVDGAPKPTAGKKDEYEWSPEPGANPGRSATRMVGALGKASDGTWYLTDLEKRSPATKTPYLYVLFPYQATNAHPPFEVGTKYKATFYANHDKIQSVLVGGQRFDFELGDTTVWEPKELPSKDGGHWAWVNGAPDPVAGTKDIYAWKSDDTRLPPPREEVSQAPAPTGESESSGNLPLCDQPPLEKRTYRVAVNVSFVGGSWKDSAAVTMGNYFVSQLNQNLPKGTELEVGSPAEIVFDLEVHAPDGGQKSADVRIGGPFIHGTAPSHYASSSFDTATAAVEDLVVPTSTALGVGLLSNPPCRKADGSIHR